MGETDLGIASLEGTFAVSIEGGEGLFYIGNNRYDMERRKGFVKKSRWLELPRALGSVIWYGS